MRRLLRRLGIVPAGVSTPRRPLTRDPHYDPEAFGRFSEGVARLIGTARFLVFQTVIVIAWIGLNIAFDGLRFDEYPFILLTLALSLQAAYAAPLILLAQTRQGERDRITSNATAARRSGRAPRPSTSRGRSPPSAWRSASWGVNSTTCGAPRGTSRTRSAGWRRR